MSVYRICATLIALAFAFSAFGQKRFQPGYYIDNNNNRIEGLIKNNSWIDNPVGFEFKTDMNSKVNNMTLETAKEFGIGDMMQFIRAEVNIDRSSFDFRFLSSEKGLKFQKESLFLKVLQAGSASLYSYRQGRLKRYFYSTESQPITQLEYKVYSQDGRIAYNNTYKSQLLQDVSCDKPNLEWVKSLEYKQTSLVQYFKKYYACKGVIHTSFSEQEKEEKLFKYRILAGINHSSMVIQHERFGVNNDLGSKASFTLGAELEFFLPGPRQELSIVFQPSLNLFNTTGDLQEVVEVKYNAVVGSIGLRKYLPVSERTRLFIGGYLDVNVPLVKSIPLSLYIDGLTYTTDTNYSLSLGIEINDKLSAEAKHSFERDLLSSWEEWMADFQTTTIRFRYRIFD